MKIKIIAEVGSVHDGSVGNALKLMKIAKEAGAHYVKFQMHIANAETTKKAPSPKYFNSENRYDYFKRTAFSTKQWMQIINYAKKIKIKFMCSVFSKEAINKLIKLNVKNIKVPSGELNNYNLINFLSKKKLNIFLSTGMSNFKEIDNAVKILKTNSIVLLQCTSMYPCPLNKVGLNIFDIFKIKYQGMTIGFSDHTLTPTSSILALSKGAEYFEKHITFSKKMYGSDAQFAMEPEEFALYCKYLNEAYVITKAKLDKNKINSINKMKSIFEKRIVASKKLTRGNLLDLKSIKFKKNQLGIKASDYKLILNKKVNKTILKDCGIRHSDII